MNNKKKAGYLYFLALLFCAVSLIPLGAMAYGAIVHDIEWVNLGLNVVLVLFSIAVVLYITGGVFASLKDR